MKIVLSGRAEQTCDGWSRRRWLEVGTLGCFGLSLADLGNRANAGQVADATPERSALPHFGRAKACIVLFLFGAPAHQDTWDLKPKAPADIRGEFKPIATRTPGLMIGEHLPLCAERSDRYAVIRSLTHPDNTHTVAMHYMLTGVRHRRPNTNPQNAPDDHPCFGAMLNCLEDRGLWRRADRTRALAAASASEVARDFSPELASTRDWMPTTVSLNSPANQVSANNHIFPGFFAGLIGGAYDPLFVSQSPHAEKFRPLPTVDSPSRLIERRQLALALQQSADHWEQLASAGALSKRYDRALSLLTSATARRAFDIETESAESRDRYGRTPFGQGCLLARRLVEAGVPLVTVNWERDDAYWDTHKNNFIDLKQKLLPNFDRGFSALLDDLFARGLLDETLVVALGEFGRTPKVNKAAGRDHWAPCNSVVLAGAGFGGGKVWGGSDREAAYPAFDAVTPEDLAATIFHLLGVDPKLVVRDPAGRPIHVATGRPIVELLS